MMSVHSGHLPAEQISARKFAALDKKLLSRHARGSELILAMRLDRHVGGRVGHASEAKAVARLVVIQEGLVGLIDGARKDLAGATRARSCTARVRQLNAFLLGLVKDIRVFGALEFLGAIRGLQGYLEV